VVLVVVVMVVQRHQEHQMDLLEPQTLAAEAEAAETVLIQVKTAVQE
jgi:hypothetical protein